SGQVRLLWVVKLSWPGAGEGVERASASSRIACALRSLSSRTRGEGHFFRIARIRLLLPQLVDRQRREIDQQHQRAEHHGAVPIGPDRESFSDGVVAAERHKGEACEQHRTPQSGGGLIAQN